MEDKFNFGPVWKSILNIYQVFADLCDRNGLRYYLAYGSVLGAIRHHGYIPWDDDLDVMMPRPDYEKFMQLAEKEMPKHLRLINWKNTPCYDWLFCKLQNVDRVELERVEKEGNRPLPQGIYIDIFPIDGYPDGKVARLVRRLQDVTFFARRIYRTYDKEIKKIFRYRVCSMIGFFMAPFYPGLKTKKDFIAYNERRILKYPFGTTKMSADGGNYLTLGFTERLFPTDCYGTPRKVPFESIQANVPEKAEKYLEVQYGDYMQLPPAEQQVPSHAEQTIAPWRL